MWWAIALSAAYAVSLAVFVSLDQQAPGIRRMSRDNDTRDPYAKGRLQPPPATLGQIGTGAQAALHHDLDSNLDGPKFGR